MINIKKTICMHPDCKIQPVFNMEGQSSAIYCLSHKIEGMVDVRSKSCIHPNCKTRSSYNMEDKATGIYCAKHKLEGMVDVRNPTCIHPNCKTRPVFNMEGQTKELYCSEHKLEGMVDIKTRTCIYPNCKIYSSFNMEGQKTALYCSSHKLDGMIRVKSKYCKSEWCSTIVREKYEGYCLFCYIHLFPDKPVSCNYKTKECSVVEHVKSKFPELKWISDKKISGGCSKRRPDLLIDLLYQIIIIEIDENQHSDYDCSCENKRIMELSQDLAHRPIIFIRFNPDEYDNNGINVSSCWVQNNKGILVVKKTKKKEWSQRLKTLEENINYWINPEHTTNKTIEIIHLFYDI